MKKIYILVITLCIGLTGFGQMFSGTYTFGNNGDTNSFVYNGSTITDLTVSNITKNGITSSSSNGNFRATNWDTGSTNNGAAGGTVNLGKYFEFTITAASGYTINNPTINFGVGRSATGTRRFQWRSSADGYSTLMTVTASNASVTSTGNVIETPDANANYTGNTVSLTTSGQTSITFRFYAYGAEATAGTGGLAGPLTFTGTLEAEASCTTYTLPFAEGFEDGSVPPNCWASFDNGIGTGQSWEIEDGSNYPAQGGTFSAKINPEFLPSGTSEDWLVTPAIDLTGSSNNQLSFYARDIFSGVQGTTNYAVKISTTSQTDMGSFTDLQTYDETTIGSSYNLKTIDLSAYDTETEVYIAFVLSQNDSDGWLLDTITITGGCTSPSTQASDFIATAIDGGTGTATLNWSRGDGDNLLVVMRENGAVTADPTSGADYTANAAFGSGDEIGTGNFVVYNGNLNSVNVSGLNVSNTYHVAIYEYNDASTCYNLIPLTGNFLVACQANALPFTEGFENGGTLPSCWATYRGANGLGTNNDWTTTTEALSGTYAAYVEYENVIGDLAEDWLVTPAITIPSGTNAQLSFFTKDEYTTDYGSEYTVRVSTTSQTDRNSFTILETYDETELGNTYNQKIVDLSAYANTTIYIAFVLTQSDGDSWFVDDVAVEDVPVPNDSDTQVYEASIQIPAATLNPFDMLHDFLAVDVFGFVIEDMGGSDGLPTNVTTMRFVPGPNNTADWSDIMQGVTITDENSVSYTPTSTAINDNEIIVSFATPIVIPDMDYLGFTLGMYLNPSPVVDHSIVQFQINAINSGFVADANGSGFDDLFIDGDVVGNNMTLDVEATTVRFQQQPTDTYINAAMWPAVTVAGTDDFGNIDIDYDGFEIEITSEGMLDGGSVTATTVDGIAIFGNIVHTAPGMFLWLNASGESLFMDEQSDSFDVLALPIGATDLFISEYIEGSGNNKYIEIYNGTGSAVNLIDYSIELYANGASTPNNTETFSSGFPATLADGEVLVLKNSSATIYAGTAYNSSVCNFNGDDALVLKKSGVIIDVFGNVGCDPGTEWSDGGLSTLDRTLVRNADVCGGVTADPSDPPCDFPTLVTEWTSYAINTVSNLGSHTANCAPVSTDYVYNNGWTPSDPSGVSTDTDNIQVIAGTTVLTAPTIANNLTIDAGTTLNINADAAFTASGTVENNGSLVLNSTSTEYSSLIANTITGSGTVSYDRHVNTGAVGGEGGNDLISAPVVGQTFGDFATANSNIITDPNDATRKLFGPFDKVTGAFLIYETDTNASTPLVSGEGYRAASTDGNGFTFTGTVNTGNVNRTIDYSGTGIPYREWNLIGNPYPSYIKLSDFLSANNGQFDTNSSGVYGYDDSASNYTIWNDAYALANPNALIAPGQGFFVASQTGGGSISFTAGMRSTGSSDDFIPGRAANIAHIKLNAATNGKNLATDFYFIDQAGRGLDPGFDTSIFGKVAPATSLYSQLVEDNSGIDMAIQSLPYSDLGSDVAIPLGVNVAAGQTVILSIVSSTLPEGIEVYLEDTVNNTYTLLNNGAFTFTASSTLTETGRFFLRFTDSTLSVPTQSLDQLSIYTTSNPKNLFIKGILEAHTNASIYDLQGRLVLTSDLDSSLSYNVVNVDGLSDGIYVVKLSNATQQKTQKVIIQ